MVPVEEEACRQGGGHMLSNYTVHTSKVASVGHSSSPRSFKVLDSQVSFALPINLYFLFLYIFKFIYKYVCAVLLLNVFSN